MKITVLGATGGSGLELVRQGLDLGHEVTAVVRGPDRLPAELRERADVVQADVMDPDAIASAVAGRDAVLSAMGPRGTGPTTVCSGSTRAILAAMERTGTRRLLMVSAAGLESDAGDGLFSRYALKPIVRRFLRHVYADLAVAERLVRESRTDWTIVRPARLTDAGRTHRYRTARDLSVRGGHTTTRADLADCMLKLIEDGTSAGHVVSVAT
ncbi:SDR family oxidoreductase [Nonomuraea salmonea]|uniref:SDR family oxidoreductase n=1 Tax=Nonomuraea salmonea TaxID=46181 RepID=A0ABV5NGG4_9ACTN